ncbi:MAG: CHAT domain-containing protein [Alphaproteobacteria bacterium]|nr:CHAT domain-containing protein [Alphaproteobacteria bacterium]
MERPAWGVLHIDATEARWTCGGRVAAALARDPGLTLRDALDELERARAGLAGSPHALHDAALALGTVLSEGWLRGAVGAAVAEAIRGLPPEHRLQVCVEVAAPTLHDLPWDLLRIPEASGGWGPPLALHPEVSVVHGAPRELPPGVTPAARPLRILALFGDPFDPTRRLAALDVAAERSVVLDVLGPLQRRGLVDVLWMERADLGRLREVLEAWPCHVLHISAHGQAGALLLEDHRGYPRWVDARTLWAEALCVAPPRLVHLAGCASASAPPGGHAGASASLAEALLELGVPAVVGMTASVGDGYARRFSAALYRHLARDDRSVADAFASARQEARRPASGRDPEPDQWPTPTLLVRAVGWAAVDAHRAEVLSRPQPSPGTPEGRRGEVVRLRAALERGPGAWVHGPPGAEAEAVVSAVLAALRAEGWAIYTPARAGELDVRIDRATPAVALLNASGLDDAAPLQRWSRAPGALRLVVLGVPAQGGDVLASSGLERHPVGSLGLAHVRMRVRRSGGDDAVARRVFAATSGLPGPLRRVEGLLQRDAAPSAEALREAAEAGVDVGAAAARASAVGPLAGTMLTALALHTRPADPDTLMAADRSALRRAALRCGRSRKEVRDEALAGLEQQGLAVRVEGGLRRVTWLAPPWVRRAVLGGLSADVRRTTHEALARRWTQLAVGARGAEEVDFLEEALHHTRAGEGIQHAPEAVFALVRALRRAGRQADAERALRDFVDAMPPHTAATAAALHELGLIAQRRGEMAHAERFFVRSMEMDRALGHHVELIASHEQLASIRHGAGDAEGARRHVAAAMRLCAWVGDRNKEVEVRLLAAQLGLEGAAPEALPAPGTPALVARWRIARAEAARRVGDLAAAAEELVHAREEALRVADVALDLDLLQELALLERARGELETAWRMLRSVTSRAEAAGHLQRAVDGLRMLMGLAPALGFPAEPWRERGVHLALKLGGADAAKVQVEAGERALLERKPEEALRYLEPAMHCADDRVRVDALKACGAALIQLDRLREARVVLEQAVAACQDPARLRNATYYLGMLDVIEGDHATGRRRLARVIAEDRRVGNAAGCAAALDQMGRSFLATAEFDLARQLFEEAQELTLDPAERNRTLLALSLATTSCGDALEGLLIALEALHDGLVAGDALSSPQTLALRAAADLLDDVELREALEMELPPVAALRVLELLRG